MPLKVLYITPFMNLGGTEKHMLTLIRALGASVEAYVAGPLGAACKEFSFYGIKVLNLPGLKVELDVRSVRKALNLLREVIRGFEPDIIHVHAGVECGILARLATRHLKVRPPHLKAHPPCTESPGTLPQDTQSPGIRIPLIFTIHGYPGIRRFSPDYLIAARLGNVIADKVITVSDVQRRLLLRLGLRRDKCVMIYNGILDPLRDEPERVDGGMGVGARMRADEVRANAELSADAGAGADAGVSADAGMGAGGREDIRRTYGISPDEIIIGSVARLEKIKGQHHLLRAYAGVLKVKPFSRLVIVGWGKEDRSLRELAQALGIADRVIFTGAIPDAVRIMPAFDVFAMPSIREPFGIAAVEAMACGLPVVASDVDGLREVVAPGVTGLLVKPGDEVLLRDAILRLINNLDERVRMGDAGRVRFCERFTAQVMAQSTLAVYREVLTHKTEH